jgi:hypothetical protein
VKVYNEELRNLYSVSFVIRVLILTSVRRSVCIVHGDMRNAYKILFRKS